jgi:hypothetical protein
MATIEIHETDSARLRRYNQAAILLQRWSTEDSDYDQQVGALLDRELVDSPMQCRDDDESSA